MVLLLLQLSRMACSSGMAVVTFLDRWQWNCADVGALRGVIERMQAEMAAMEEELAAVREERAVGELEGLAAADEAATLAASLKAAEAANAQMHAQMQQVRSLGQSGVLRVLRRLTPVATFHESVNMTGPPRRSFALVAALRAKLTLWPLHST